MREEKTVVQVEPEKVQDAVSYDVGSNSIEGLILTEEELKKIHTDVQAGKGEKSFLMAVLQYVQQKKNERDLHIKEGMSHGAHRK